MGDPILEIVIEAERHLPHDVEPCILEELIEHRLSERSDVSWIAATLGPFMEFRLPVILASDEIGHQETSTRCYHAGHLGKNACGIWEVVEGGTTCHHFEGLVVEGEAFRIALFEVHIVDRAILRFGTRHPQECIRRTEARCRTAAGRARQWSVSSAH